MNITKQDVGKKVLLKNGDTCTIDGWNENSIYAVSSAPYSWTAQGFYMHNGSEHPLNIVSFWEGESTSHLDPHSLPSPECSHSWVGSGFSGGNVWCKDCDIDYSESAHGDSGL